MTANERRAALAGTFRGSGAARAARVGSKRRARAALAVAVHLELVGGDGSPVRASLVREASQGFRPLAMIGFGTPSVHAKIAPGARAQDALRGSGADAFGEPARTCLSDGQSLILLWEERAWFEILKTRGLPLELPSRGRGLVPAGPLELPSRVGVCG